VRPTPMLEIRQDRSVSTVKQEKKWWEFWK
jgi:hypothetical protein